MKNKLLNTLSAALLCIVLLAGCAPKNDTSALNSQNAINSSGKTVTIAASFYPIYIMAMNVAKDMPNVKVIDMTQQTTGCLHDYTVTTDDMKNLENAQYFIINGAGMESFMDKVINQFPDLKIIDSSTGIELIKGEGDEGDNPHLWVGISDAIQQVKNIGSQLAALDPDNASDYTANTDAYVKKLEAEREKMHKALDGVQNRDIITFHEAFPYFAKEFSLNIVGVIEREPGSQPSAKELADTIETINSLGVKALFAEPQYSATAAETIAMETGAKVYTLDPGVTGPMDADAYIDIMDSNLKILLDALS
jgi:zinc transport system substrate-binding protein